MKKSRKHIVLSTLLAIFVLSAQTVFFPLHYYLTHHNTSLHSKVEQEGDLYFAFKKADHPLSGAVEDKGCYWCDMFAHQGYFIEKFSEFIFISPEAAQTQPLVFAYTFLKANLPTSRAPPACQIL